MTYEPHLWGFWSTGGYSKTPRDKVHRSPGRFSKIAKTTKFGLHKLWSLSFKIVEPLLLKITIFGVKMLYLSRLWADVDDFFDFFDYNCHSELIETLFGYRIGLET